MYARQTPATSENIISNLLPNYIGLHMASLSFEMSRDEFRAEIFEQRPKIWRSGYQGSPLDWGVVDRALDLQDPSRELLKVLRKGRVEPDVYVEQFMDIGLKRRRIIKPKLYELLEGGATIVLNRIEIVSPEIRELCMQIGRFVGAQTTCNAYATLGDLAATNVHWDTHDVFVVQTTGKKFWRLYQPTHFLPISSQTSNDHKNEVPLEPYIETMLEAGDVMYVPRGWWHKVEPISSSDTIHFTVAVHAPLILDYIIWACANELPNHISLRRSLINPNSDREKVVDAAKIIFDIIQDDSLIEAFSLRSQGRERGGSNFQISRLLGGETDFSPKTLVAINSRYVGEIAKHYIVNGQEVLTSGAHRAVLDVLSTAMQFEMSEISERVPQLSWTELCAVIKDLIRSDVASVNEALIPNQFHSSLALAKA